MGKDFHSPPSILVLPVLCAVSGGTAQEQIGSSCFSRPIKLRVNLAPQMMEEGATPLEKNFAAASYLPENVELLHQADYYFSHQRKKKSQKKSLSRSKEKTKISLRACACRPCPHAMHIQLFRLQQKDTSNHFPSNFVLSPLLNGRWPAKSLLWPVCIWKLVVFWGGSSE